MNLFFKIGCVATLLFSAIGLGATPRAEYPRPQFERADWQNLNGEWTYQLDLGKSGMNRHLYESKGFDDKITVPFCAESKLSGVEHKDFIPAMWYHRQIQIPESWQGKRTMLNFGGVDFFTGVYLDGKLVARHWGGNSPFSCDITEYVKDGKPHDLVVRVEDDLRSSTQPSGKQCKNYFSSGPNYTRTTGIWQTVWMEPVSDLGLKSVYIIPDLDNSQFIVKPDFRNLQSGQTFEVKFKDGNRVVASARQSASPVLSIPLKIKNVKTWSPEHPFLYDVEMNVYDSNGNIVDRVNSYAGMRKVHVEGNQYFLNNQPYYLRLVLDQGFYPDGIWTAPSDEALRNDIELSKAAGFNGARLHQKVFEERYHYWADKLGYLTWGEAPSWGANLNNPLSGRNFLPEWESVVVRDRNHPSIIAWTPFNETWERPDNDEAALQHDRIIEDVYRITKNLDYRPVNDASGNYHVITDLWTVHTYQQNPERLAEWFELKDGRYPCQDPRRDVPYSGQPFFVDEFGGIKWVIGKQYADNTWGYGEGPRTEEEFYERLEGLVDAINNVPYMSGYCYTQLTDVEQEQNGIYNYDRTPKFNMERIKAIFSKVPEKFKVNKK
jgi:beta-galactosidase/beta-glucuronidase